MNGDRRSATCLRTDVGIGSAADDLSGSFQMALIKSSVDTGENALNEEPGFKWLKVGGDALLVLSLTLATFSMKNPPNVSTSIADDAGTLLRPVVRLPTSIVSADRSVPLLSCQARSRNTCDDAAAALALAAFNADTSPTTARARRLAPAKARPSLRVSLLASRHSPSNHVMVFACFLSFLFFTYSRYLSVLCLDTL